MMTDQEIQQAIDACRPGSDDLQRPEMAALAEAIRCDPDVRRRYDCSQQFDASVRGVFRDVPVPAGLADRLLAAVEPSLGRATEELQEPVTPLSSGHDVRKDAEDASRWPHRRRRRILSIVAGGLTAAAALAGFLLLVPYFGVAEPRPDDRLPGEIMVWADAVVRQGWNEDLQTAQSLRRPLDRAVRASPQRWCSIATAYDSQTIVYDVAPRGADMALVFCMRSRVGKFDASGHASLERFFCNGRSDAGSLASWGHGLRACCPRGTAPVSRADRGLAADRPPHERPPIFANRDSLTAAPLIGATRLILGGIAGRIHIYSPAVIHQGERQKAGYHRIGGGTLRVPNPHTERVVYGLCRWPKPAGTPHDRLNLERSYLSRLQWAPGCLPSRPPTRSPPPARTSRSIRWSAWNCSARRKAIIWQADSTAPHRPRSPPQLPLLCRQRTCNRSWPQTIRRRTTRCHRLSPTPTRRPRHRNWRQRPRRRRRPRRCPPPRHRLCLRLKRLSRLP